MSVGTPDKLIASSFGLAGFAIAIVAGMAAGNPSGRVLTVAIVSMIACHFVGLIAGSIGERVVDEYMVEYRAARPIGGAPIAPGETTPTVKPPNGVS